MLCCEAASPHPLAKTVNSENGNNNNNNNGNRNGNRDSENRNVKPAKRARAATNVWVATTNAWGIRAASVFFVGGCIS
jgi:hypothetical protein